MTDIFETEFRKAPHYTRHESAAGVRISPGPYVGIVKNNTDPTRSGKLQVWIPELGGSANDEGSWKTVSYCTPFYGVTNHVDNTDYQGHPHSYGMWFVPPDIGVKVLCTFANGNPFDGYWFGCIPDWPYMYDLPGMAGALDGSNPAPQTNGPSPLATTDLQDLSKLQNKRLAHDYQKAIWDKQNLTNDPDRGPGTSSAFRETPSSVFGISTPGAPLNPQDPQFKTNDVGDQEWGVRGRKGGHTLVMDDGDAKGNNQMFRMRSANGHMILMNDTKDFIYIINSKGTAWVEINAAGDINVYAQSNLNIEAKGGMQLETQGALKLHGKTVDIVSDGAFNMQGTDINILGSGNTKITGKSSLHLKAKNTYLTGDSCIQIKSDGHIDLKGTCHTINTGDAAKAQEAGSASSPSNMPTAEPWSGHKSPQSPTSQPAYGQKQGIPPSNGNNSSSAGAYGAANNFGSSNVQQSYGPMTNNISPVTYTNSSTGFYGQGYYTTPYVSSASDSTSGTSYLISGAIAGAVAGIVYGGGGGFDVSKLDSQNSTPNYTTGELQNNPGNLPYNSNDSFAVGFANNIAVYAKPEQGIAALALLFDKLNTSSTTTCMDLVVGYLNLKSKSDPNAIDMTRFISNNLGINATDYVALSDHTTRLGWIATVINYRQKRIIYTYDQIVNGCALSLNMDSNTYLQNVQPLKQPWQNAGGNNRASGFVNPAQTPSVANNGASPLKAIGAALAGAATAGFINNIFKPSSQQAATGATSPTQTVNAATGGVSENDNSGYRDMSATKVPPTDANGIIAYGGGNPAAISASSPTAANGLIAYNGGSSATDNVLVRQNDRLPGDQTGSYNLAATDPSSGYSQGYYTEAYGGQAYVAPTTTQNYESEALGATGVPQISSQINKIDGFQRVYNPTTDSYNFIGKASDGSTVSIRQDTINTLQAQGQTSASLGETGVDGVRDLQNYNDARVASISANAPTNEANAYKYVEPTPNTDYAPLDPGIATQAHNYRNDTSYLYDTTPTRDTVKSPDAAAFGDNYSSTIASNPSNAASVATSNPGDLATGGYGTGNNQSDTASFRENNVAADPITSSAANNTPALQYDPRTNEVVTVNNPQSGQALQYDPRTNQVVPVTGAAPAPGAGGQTGAQTTPSGSAQTGAGAASC
jgi:hypothetical protein